MSLLFTGVIIWASRKLVSLVNHNTACTTLIQWNIPLGAKWHRVCRFAPGSGQNGLIPYFFIFSISQEHNHICLHFGIEYLYCHSLSIPAKYYDNRLDIFNVGSFFLSYAILPRLPLLISNGNTNQSQTDTIWSILPWLVNYKPFTTI